MPKSCLPADYLCETRGIDGCLLLSLSYLLGRCQERRKFENLPEVQKTALFYVPEGVRHGKIMPLQTAVPGMLERLREQRNGVRLHKKNMLQMFTAI